MFKYIFITCLFLLALGPPGLKADEIYQPDSNCLKIQYPDGWYNGNQYSNPDSVKVDSCEDSQTYLRKYSRQGFLVYLDVYPFTPKPILAGDRKTWQDMDSQYVALRVGFKEVEEKFGSFTFKRYYKDHDSLELITRAFYLDFSKDQLIDSVVGLINSLENVVGCKEPRLAFLLGIRGGNNELQLPITFEPNPVIDILKLHFNMESKTEKIKILIYDALGNNVLTLDKNIENEIDLNISNLEPGAYFLKTNYSIIKFIKE